MGREFLKQTTEILRMKQRRKQLKRIMISLSVVVAMLTSYLLILPAVTMERDPICGQAEHTHTEGCYEHHLICGKVEQEGQPEQTRQVLSCSFTTHTHDENCYDTDGQLVCGFADYVIHTHDANCFDADGNLVCTLPEVKVHEHDDSCYKTETVLTCSRTESSVQELPKSSDPFTDGSDVFGSGDNNVYVGDSEGGHIHTEECYETKHTLTCGKDEIIPHTHTAECYDENGNLVCGRLEIQEHQHDENCFMTVTTEAVEGHTHTDECYEDVLICDKAEHVHTEECYPQETVEENISDIENTDLPDVNIHEESFSDEISYSEKPEENSDDTNLTEITSNELQEYQCGKEEHTHGEMCLDREGNLICELEEHIHDENCIISEDESDSPEKD